MERIEKDLGNMHIYLTWGENFLGSKDKAFFKSWMEEIKENIGLGEVVVLCSPGLGRQIIARRISKYLGEGYTPLTKLAFIVSAEEMFDVVDKYYPKKGLPGCVILITGLSVPQALLSWFMPVQDAYLASLSKRACHIDPNGYVQSVKLL